MLLSVAVLFLFVAGGGALDSKGPVNPERPDDPRPPWRPGDPQYCEYIRESSTGRCAFNIPSQTSSCNRWSWDKYFHPDCRDWRTGFLKCEFPGKTDGLPCMNYVVQNNSYASDIVSLPTTEHHASFDFLFGGGPPKNSKQFLDVSVNLTAMGSISSIFFFDGADAPGSCLNHVGPVYMHQKDDYPGKSNYNTEEGRARFFFADTYTCLASSINAEGKLMWRMFNGATPYGEGIKFLDVRYQKPFDPTFFHRVIPSPRMPIDKPFTYSSDVSASFPAMRSNTNNMWFATNYLRDKRAYASFREKNEVPKGNYYDYRGDRLSGHLFGGEFFTPLTPPGTMRTNNVQEEEKFYYCNSKVGVVYGELIKRKGTIIQSPWQYYDPISDRPYGKYPIWTYIPSAFRYDADQPVRTQFTGEQTITNITALKRSLWSVGSYNGGQWYLGINPDSEPEDVFRNGYFEACMESKVADVKCWAWQEHHHAMSNRLNACEFNRFTGTVRCRNIREPNKMRCSKDADENTQDQFMEGQDVPVTDLGDFPLQGVLQYPSWNDMNVYMDMRNHVYNMHSDNVPYQGYPIKKPYGQVGFLFLPTNPMYHCYLATPPAAGTFACDGTKYLPTDNYVLQPTINEHATAFAQLYGVTSDRPMGRCPHRCSGRPNVCEPKSGRCFCEPSTKTTGLGCEQSIGNSTVFGTTCAYWRSLGIDLCSEAGECVDNTASGWPQCRCFGHFRGNPDQPKWKAVYASLFSAAIRDSRFAGRAGVLQSLNNRFGNSWVDAKAPNLRTSFSVLNAETLDTETVSTAEIAVDWTEYIASHQCLIWTAGIHVPPVRWRFNWNAYRDWNVIYSSLAPMFTSAISQRSVRNVYPWPLAAVTDQAGLVYSSNGLVCADYRNASFGDLYSAGQLSLFKRHRLDPFLGGVTLFGGEACVPCPDCNRANSVCAEVEIDSDRPAEERRTYCKCKENFGGPLCQIAVCPGFANGTFCGGPGRGVCPGYTGTTYPSLNSAELASNTLITGKTLASCQCTQGWSGDGCSVPLCPVDPDGNVCGTVFDVLSINRTASRGFCDTASGLCVCSDDWTGADCSIARCPIEPETDLECAGLTWYNNASRSVCNRATRVCECWRALETARVPQTQDYNDATRGFVLDSSIYLNGRFGDACESTYSSQCLAQDGTWCGKVLGCETEACNKRYAGCSILYCLGRETGTAADCATGAPKCYCKKGYFGDKCEQSVCGQFECDHSNGLDTGNCLVKCGTNAQGGECNMLAVSLNQTKQTGECKCKESEVGGVLWTLNQTDQSCDTPVPAACVSGGFVCSGETKGVCEINPATQAYQCYCKPKFSGTYCQNNDPCGGSSCNTNARRCAATKDICVCKNNYLYEAAGSACTNERCVSTGGVITSLTEESCQCPDGQPMTVTYDSNYLPRRSVNFEVHKGCRKKCPLHPTTKVECGAVPFARPWPTCNDLINNTPVWANSVGAASTCTCGFLAKFNPTGTTTDGSTYFMFWESDLLGGCIPKCSLENSMGVRKSIGSVTTIFSDDPLLSAAPGSLSTSSFVCVCKPEWEGESCLQRRCSGNASERRVVNINTGEVQCFCKGKQWCFSGSLCADDYCAPEGFCSGLTDQANTNSDCNCLLPAYGIQQSPLLKVGRRCVSLCQNGATPVKTGPRSAVCQCVPGSGTFGTFCEKRLVCNPDRPQFGGPSCTDSLCQNDGIPLLNAPGCNCQTPYLDGMLCDQGDLCAQNNGVYRSLDRACVCNPGWDKPVDKPLGFCVVNKCSEYGRPIDCRDVNCAGGYTCACAPGWVFNGFTCAYVGSQTTYCNPAYGTLKNISDTNPFLGVTCLCRNGFGGAGCATYLCNPFEEPTGPGTCGCIYPFEGAECVNDFCPPNSVGPKRVLLDNGTVSDEYECECATGYRLIKPDGRPQCVPDVTNCNPEGTIDWSPTVPLAECICKFDWTGRGCFLSRADADYVELLEYRAARIEGVQRQESKSFTEELEDTTPGRFVLYAMAGVGLAVLCILCYPKRTVQLNPNGI